MHCLTAWGQWAVELLTCSASLPGAVGGGTLATHRPGAWGIGQRDFCSASPLGSGTLAMHRLTIRGQWAVELLQHIAPVPRALGSGTRATHRPTAWGSGQCNSCDTLPHCLG